MSTTAIPVAAPRLIIRLDDAVPVLELPADMPFEALRTWLRDEVPLHAETIGGRTARLDLGTREIQLFDLRRIVNLLRDELSVQIMGLYVQPSAIHRYAERELKLKLFPIVDVDAHLVEPLADDDLELDTEDLETELEESLEEGLEVPEPMQLQRLTLPNDLDIEEEPPATGTPRPAAPRALTNEPRAHTIRRTLRSGASVRFDGDLYIFGDINPGATVTATGNIVVLGALKGVAHAGAVGDESAFILALINRPTQLRIARKIAIPPERATEAGSIQPEVATIADGEIVIQPYRGRFA